MAKITVTCVKCKNDFEFDTEDPSELTEGYKAMDTPRIFIKPCPHCGKQNKVKVSI